MAHAQKPDFVFRRNGRVHLNRRERQFSRLLAAEVCASAFIVGSNAGYTMFRGGEKGTGYPSHSPVSPCVTVCHHISTGIYLLLICTLVSMQSFCWQFCLSSWPSKTGLVLCWKSVLQTVVRVQSASSANQLINQTL